MEIREVIESHAPVRREPVPDAPLETEALLGERAKVHDVSEHGWSRVTLTGDGYMGWMPSGSLSAPGPDPTHKVNVTRTFAFPGPSIKLPPIETLSFGCRLSVASTDATFAVTRLGWHLPVRHLVPVADLAADPVAVAQLFLGTPYLWGGKTSLGLDCSALVQIAFQACGITCPRDSGPQERALGSVIDLARARRGDLIFWPGHVALVRDAETLIHANAHHMAVAVEPIAEAVARIAAAGHAISGVKRVLPRPYE